MLGLLFGSCQTQKKLVYFQNSLSVTDSITAKSNFTPTRRQSPGLAWMILEHSLSINAETGRIIPRLSSQQLAMVCWWLFNIKYHLHRSRRWGWPNRHQCGSIVSACCSLEGWWYWWWQQAGIGQALCQFQNTIVWFIQSHDAQGSHLSTGHCILHCAGHKTPASLHCCSCYWSCQLQLGAWVPHCSRQGLDCSSILCQWSDIEREPFQVCRSHHSLLVICCWHSIHLYISGSFGFPF